MAEHLALAALFSAACNCEPRVGTRFLLMLCALVYTGIGGSEAIIAICQFIVRHYHG